MNRNWNILQVNTGFQKVVQIKPVIAFKRVETPQEIIRSHTVK